MPFTIRKVGDKFCVLKAGTDEKMGCYDDRKQAGAQVRALYTKEANTASVEFNLGTIESIVEHLRVAKESPTMESVRDHVDYALEILGEMVREKSPDESIPGMPGSLMAAGSKEEYAWDGPIVFEGVITGDNRVFKPGSIEWDPETLPWAFRWQRNSTKGHEGAVPIGRVDKLERQEDGAIYGYGVIIPSLNEEAAEYLRLLEAGVASGVSVDGDSAEFDVQEMSDGTQSIEFSSMRLRSLTAVDIPAFNEARIGLEDEEEDAPVSKELANEEPEEFGGKPSQGTKPDKRLEENKKDEDKNEKRKKKMRWAYNLTASGTDSLYGIIEPCKLHNVPNVTNSLTPSVVDFVTTVTKNSPTEMNFRLGDAKTVLNLLKTVTVNSDAPIAGKLTERLLGGQRTCGCILSLNAASNDANMNEITGEKIKTGLKDNHTTRNDGVFQKKTLNLNLPLKEMSVPLKPVPSPSSTLRDEEPLKTPISTTTTIQGSLETSSVPNATERWGDLRMIYNSFNQLLSIFNDTKPVVLASAIPVKPPTEWFKDYVNPTGSPVPITVTKEGQIYGYIATWGQCHIAFPGCVQPPKGSSYKYFHTGELETVEGDCVDIGHLTFNTGHASMSDSAKSAASHYDHTGSVAADVRAGEDEHGIWVTGALRSNLSDEDIRAFRAAPMSGDWRRIAGRLELVGALAVNVPGFPVPRARALVSSGELATLVTFQESEEAETFSDYEEGLRYEMRNKLAASVRA